MKQHRFLRVAGISIMLLSLGWPGWVAVAAEMSVGSPSHFVPQDKQLDAEWVRSLSARGVPQAFRNEELKFIGMPVGGIGAGQLYLCGDGSLGCWELFNRHKYRGTGERNYAGRIPDKPVDQGFALIIEQEGRRTARCLNRAGFAEVAFTGEYPVGRVHYRDESSPCAVELEAFSPFIPLNARDSALPATLFTIRIKNVSGKALTASFLGWLENAVCFQSAEDVPGVWKTRLERGHGRSVLSHTAEERPVAASGKALRPAMLLQDFEGADYGTWTAAGEAFGNGPAHGALPWQAEPAGFEGKGFANSFLRGDSTLGTLSSPAFVIERKYVNFLIGGGNFDDTACAALLIDGAMVRRSTGEGDERLRWESWDVSEYAGRRAQIVISDAREYPGGHICADHFELSDAKRRRPDGAFERFPDFGTMALALAEVAEDTQRAAEAGESTSGPVNRRFSREGEAYAFPERRNGALLSKAAELAPGETRTLTFVLAWHFPNAAHGHEYAVRFADAPAVTNYVLDHLERLAGDTRAWRDTYYDSTLPFWLLDRLHSTLSTLATGTCQWWANGRFWAYEGVVSCPGTCTHVWNYAQAEARLFPELARSVREMQDFNPDSGGFHPDTGLVGFRGDNAYAADGQCGTVLKTYREHLCSADGGFLAKHWPNAKKALEFLLQRDRGATGLLEDEQPNTYDIAFHGGNTFVGSLYLAALRAGEEMAREMGDAAFASGLRTRFESGRKLSAERLWNGSYFIQDVDLAKFPQNQYGPGCLSDQLFGQTWAHQVGLGYLYPPDQVKRALESVWQYNWAPDVGPQNAAHRALRMFAEPGETGLFVCTWPESAFLESSFFYRNEVWTGIEYQVASNMIDEGLVEQGLALCRGIHERYHPSKRNPYNEVECGDHYARALASWGVLTALCGFEYHGPKGHIGFAPRLTPEEFQAAFTAAEGWGTFAQQREARRQTEHITLRWGRLNLRTLAFALPEKARVQSIEVSGTGGALPFKHAQESSRVLITLDKATCLRSGESLEVIIALQQP